MTSTTLEHQELRTQEEVVKFRQLMRKCSANQGFSLVEQTKLVTAASEIARNAVVYGGGGTAEIRLVVEGGGRRGIRLVVEDHGPGIENPDLALRDGYTTGGGLGLGLGGAKRLVSEFVLESKSGEGTRVTLTRWKQP